MSTSIVVEPITKTSVGMGQIRFGRDPACLGTILGSCIGLTLYHERLRIGALAHVVLPQSDGRKGPPGKFADTALPEILNMMKCEGANPSGLVAKIVGGANMFGGATGPMQIGTSNALAITSGLEEFNIQLIGSEIGGDKGRRILFDCATGKITIDEVGKTTIIL